MFGRQNRLISIPVEVSREAFRNGQVGPRAVSSMWSLRTGLLAAQAHCDCPYDSVSDERRVCWCALIAKCIGIRYLCTNGHLCVNTADLRPARAVESCSGAKTVEWRSALPTADWSTELNWSALLNDALNQLRLPIGSRVSGGSHDILICEDCRHSVA